MPRRTIVLTPCLLAALLAGTVQASDVSFQARRDYAFNAAGPAFAVADVNGDGIPDVIGLQCGNILVLLGSRGGTLHPAPPSTNGIVAGCLFALADLNGDGKVDMVISGTQIGKPTQAGVGVLLGNGDGTFQGMAFYPAGFVLSSGFVGFVAVGDFNNDGIPDIATAGNSGTWVFLGKGGGTFNPGVLFPYQGTVVPSVNPLLATADFNRDGKLDLAVSTKTGFIVLLGNGDGTFQQQSPVATHREPTEMAVADINLDGKPDIALFLSPYNNPVYIYSGDGTGGFTGPTPVSLPDGGLAVGFAIGDINGDGIPDLVNGGVYFRLGKGDGTFSPPVHYVTHANCCTVALAEPRQYGRSEIFVESMDGVLSALLSTGKGKYEDGERIPVPGGAGCGAPADYNLDGKPDLALNTPQGVAILLGTGKANAPFVNGISIPLANADCLITADLNGDGIPDLLVPTHGPGPPPSGTVVAYLGQGDGTFTKKSTTVVPSEGYLAVGDFNHDGKLDFATSSGCLAVGNGDGTFQAAVFYITNPPRGGFYEIASGDLNGDGFTDLVLTNFVQSYLYVLINDQHGGFNQTALPVSIFGPPYPVGEVVLADVNGDGKLDAVFSGGYGGMVSIYLGDGSGTLTYEKTLNEPTDYSLGAIAVADVNGDGIADILQSVGGSVSVFLGRGDVKFKAPVYFGTGALSDLRVENLHGQAPAAGLPDIVVPDVTGVTVLINTTIPSHALPPVPR